MTAAQTLAANVRRLARARGMPLTHVADFAGLGRTTTFRLLRAGDPGGPRLSTIADVLPISPVDLLRSPDAPPVAPQPAPCVARKRKEKPITPGAALGELRALLDHARATDAGIISVRVDVADAATHCADTRATDLLAVLGALDLADRSPRMILRRTALIGRLRLDGGDDEARSQVADLCAATKLRRHLRDTIANAVERDDDDARARRLRSILFSADAETLGWQCDALAAMGDARA